MIKPRQEDQAEPLFITEEVEAELIAAGYEFSLPSHARAASTSELCGWRPGEMLSEVASGRLAGIGTVARERNPRAPVHDDGSRGARQHPCMIC